jgi:hypothetical protein
VSEPLFRASPEGRAVVRITRDFLAGALFLAFGVGGAIVALGYRMGTATNMGPAYFPVLVSIVVAMLGVSLVVRSFLQADRSEPAIVWEIRPVVFISAGIIAFMLLIDSHGLIPAVTALTVLGCLARRGAGIIETLVLLAVLLALAILIFIYGLNLPLKLAE